MTFNSWDTEQGRYEMKLSRAAAFQALQDLEVLLAAKAERPRFSARRWLRRLAS